MGGILTKLKGLFAKKLQLTLIGLDNCGKTTFANQLAYNDPKSTLPTIGMNKRTLKKGSILIIME